MSLYYEITVAVQASMTGRLEMNGKKLVICILTVLLMTISFVSLHAKTVHAADVYGLWVGSIEVTSENKDNVTGEGLSGEISYDPATNTLTLNNAAITSGYVYYLNNDKYAGSYSGAGLYSTSSKEVRIELIGNSSIEPKISLSGDYYYNKVEGINAGDVIFTGSGSITVSGYDYGITAKNVTVDEGSKVSVNANNGSTGPCTGVYAESLAVNGELNSASRAVHQPSTGISAKTINIGKTGAITAKAESPNTSYDAESIRINESIIVDGVLTAGTMDYEYGIYGSGDDSTLTVNNSGVITAMGRKQALANLTLVLDSDSLRIVAGDDESSALGIEITEIGPHKYISIKEQEKADDTSSDTSSDTPSDTSSGTPSDTSSGTSSGTSSDIPVSTVDPADQKGADGTALGVGASAAAAEAAITSMTSDKDLPGAVFNKLQLKSSKQTNTSVTLSWKKVTGAKKYVIYGNKCGKNNKMQRLAESTGKSKKFTKVLGKKVKKGTYYKFMIIALDKNDKVISSSKIVHVATKGGKVCNISKVTTKAKKNKVSIKKGNTFKLAGKQVAASKKLKVSIHRAVCYESSNPKIATVSKKGVIKGKKKGTCYVYAYAQNGVFAKIKVTIK